MQVKRSTLVVLAVLCSLIVAMSAAAVVHADVIGELVSNSAPKGPGVAVPPGHYGIVAQRAKEFLNDKVDTPHRTIYAKALMDGVDLPDKADQLDDFFILDIRKPVDYVNGHISGAVNVQFEYVAEPENLAKLPTDKPILVVCYTGHTASQTNAILNLLGYNAWTLRFGMTSWAASSSTKVWSSSVSQAVNGGNYPVVTGSNPTQ